MVSFLTILNGIQTRLAAIVVSVGAADADKMTATDSGGQLDNSLVKWAAPGAIGATIRSTIKATTIDASGALAASAYAKVSGVGGSFNGAIETQPNAYAQAHLVCLDPVSPSANPALRLIQPGLRAYQMAISSGGAGSFTFTNLSSGGFTTNFQSNQNAISLPLTLANVNAAIGYGAQFNFQLGDGTTLYHSGGIAYRQETAFTSALSTQNAIVSLSSMTLGSATEKFRIVSAGRFLLGTAIDDGSNLMQVAGSAAFTGALSVGAALSVVDAVSASKSVAGLFRQTFRNSDISASRRSDIFIATGIGTEGIFIGSQLSGAYIDNRSGGPLLFQTSGSSFLSVDASGNLVSTSATGSASVTQGAITTVGGVGIGGSLNVGGSIKTTNTTASVGPTTGAMVVSGGAGIAGAINNPGLQIAAAGVLQTQGVGLGSVVGNARGVGAVDLQAVRTLATQVASGSYATLLGGSGNTAPGLNSVLSGGANNSANGSYSSLLGGQFNAVSSNFASVGGGTYNTANGGSSTVSGGYQNTASANAATIPGGQFAVANRPGQFSYSGGRFAVDGDAQYDLFVVRRQTIDATATELFLDGSGASARITIANNASLAYDICISAHSTSDRTKQAVFNRRGKIYKLTTAASTALLSGEIAENIVGALPWTATVSADTTNGSLKITVTGEAAVNINWVATVQAVEITG